MNRLCRIVVPLLALFVCASLGATAGEPAAGSGRFNARVIVPPDFTISGWKKDLTRSPIGSLYVANNNLLRFDGVRWQTIQTPGLFPVVSVGVDDRGRIWVGGLGAFGYVDATETGEPRFNSLSGLLGEDYPPNQIHSIICRGEDVFLIEDFAILHWDGLELQRSTFDWNENPKISVFLFEGDLYAYAAKAGLFREVEGRFELLPEFGVLSEGQSWISMHRRSDGSILCLTTEGCYLFGEDGLKRFETEVDSLLQSRSPTGSADSGTGMIGVTFYYHGVCFIDEEGKVIDLILEAKGAKLLNAASMCYVSDGNWWVACSIGFVSIRELGYRRFVQPEAYYWSPVRAMTWHDGRIFVLAAFNLFEVTETEGRVGLLKPVPLPKEVVDLRAMVSVGKELLIGFKGGVAVYGDAGVSQLILTGDSAPARNRVFPGADEGLVYHSLGTKFNRLIQRDDQWVLEPLIEQSNLEVINSVVEVGEGRFVMGTRNSGLLQFREQADGTWIAGTEPALPTALTEGWAYAVKNGEGDVLVIAESGVFQLGEDFTFGEVQVDIGRIGDNYYGVKAAAIEGGEGFYLSLPSSDESVERGPRIGRLSFAPGGKIDWEEFYLTGTSTAGDVYVLLPEMIDGRRNLWVGGVGGLLRYDLGGYSPPKTPWASLSLVRSTATDETLWGGVGKVWPNFTWEYSRRSLLFEFSTTPELPGPPRFQTQLEGFDQNWSSVSGKAFREFTNLREGDYQILVRGVDRFGRVGPVSSYAFSIKAPWYRTPWAYGGYVVAVPVILGFFVRLRTHRLNQHAGELESVVKKRTAELESTNLELIKANSVKDDFLARMSHEIRNPLNGILGITRMLNERKSELCGDGRAVDYLARCSNHLNQLLTDVLDCARLDAGRMELVSRPFNARQVVEDVVLMHEEIAHEKNLMLRSTLAEVACLWVGDACRLKQILINIVGNACKYTVGGQVEVRFYYEQHGATIQARFEVEDTGPGIAKDQQAVIFEKFTRLSGKPECAAPGAGLGLAIASEMAKLLGGRIDLDSAVGRGSCFILTLPFVPLAETADVLTKEAGLEVNLAGVRALVADDLDFNRFIVGEMLGSSGASVVEVEDGELALQALRRERFDLVLLDINMPRLTGMEVVSRWLQEHSSDGPRPVFVAFSAYVSEDMVKRCQAAGFDHFLEKPIDQNTLFSILPPALINGGSKSTKTGLIDYLSDGVESRERSLERYRHTILSLLGEISQTVTLRDMERMRQAIHKFRGVANIIPDENTLAILERIKEAAAQGDWALSDREAGLLMARVCEVYGSGGDVPATTV